MSDPTQNPPPDQSGSHPPPPPDSAEGQAPPPPPGAPAGPAPGQGSYGTTPPPPPPPPPGGWQQPGTMPPPVQATGGIGQPADLLPRFVARLVDFILVGFVQGFVVLLIFAAVAGLNQGGAPWTGLWMSSGTSWAAGAVSSVISAAFYLGYFTIMESRRGQTLGKMIMKLETRGPGGGHPTTEQALKRNAFTAIGILGVVPFLGAVAGLLSLAAFIMIAVTISQDTVTRHGWHDNFAGGTTVIRVG